MSGKRGDQVSRTPLAYAGLGMEMISPVLVLGGLGYWLDGRWDTRPWLAVVGATLGMATGMYSVIRRLLTRGERSRDGGTDS